MGKHGRDKVIQAPTPAPATAVSTGPEVPPAMGWWDRWLASIRTEAFVKTMLWIVYLIIGFIAGMVLGFMYYGWVMIE